MISTFLVEVHLDDVFEVLLVVVGVEFLFNETYMYINIKEDSLKKLWRLIYTLWRYLTFQPLGKKTSYRSLSYKKFHKRQNYRKGRYSHVHFWENCKTNKIEVTGPKKAQFMKIFSILTLLVILSFINFVYLKLFCRTPPRWFSQGSSGD